MAKSKHTTKRPVVASRDIPQATIDELAVCLNRGDVDGALRALGLADMGKNQ